MWPYACQGLCVDVRRWLVRVSYTWDSGANLESLGLTRAFLTEPPWPTLMMLSEVNTTSEEISSATLYL